MTIKHVALSIALLAPAFGTTMTTAIHAEQAQSQQQEVTYVSKFFSQDINNFDQGYTISGLYTCVETLLQQQDSTKASEWHKIDIANKPAEAAHFLCNHKSVLEKAGVTLPASEHEVFVTIKETIGWELVDHVLFSDDQEIIKHYENTGWDQLITDVRNIFANTQYADVGNDLPMIKDFPVYKKYFETLRCQHVQNQLNKHMHRFPSTMQARSKDMNVTNRAQTRMTKIIAK